MPSFLKFILLSVLCASCFATYETCSEATERLRDEKALLNRIRVYYPMMIGEVYSYLLNDQLVRVGSLNGEEYQLFFHPNSTFIGGATNADLYYFVRATQMFDAKSLNFTLSPLSQNSPLMKEIVTDCKLVWKRYREENVVDELDIVRLAQETQNLSLKRLSFFSFYGAGNHEAKAVMGWLDGTEHPGLYGGLHGMTLPRQRSNQIQIEREYPWLILPERAIEGDVHEFIRLAADEDVEGAVPAILRVVANTMAYKYGWTAWIPKEGAIYALAPKKQARLYQLKYGFQIAFTPEDLHDSGDKYIVKISLNDFFHRYFQLKTPFPVLRR